MQNSRWLVSRESKVSFWRDRWLGDPLISNFNQPPFGSLSDVVSTYISDGQWCLPEGATVLIPRLGELSDEAILRDKDRLIWEPNSFGELTGKSYYQFLTKSNAQPPAWVQHIWAQFIPPSRSIFCWRLFLGRIPTDDKLAALGYSSCSVCSLCYNASETQQHLFLTCPFAMSIWSYIGHLFNIAVPQQTGSTSDFFMKIITQDRSKQVNNLLRTALMAGFSTIWHTRNKQRFDDVAEPIASSWSYISRAIQEGNVLQTGTMRNSQTDLIVLHKLGVKQKPCKVPKIIPVFWYAPKPGCIKVNTDGAAEGTPGEAGCGGVFRNSRGFPMGGFSRYLGIANAYEAELWGVISAVQYAKDKGWRNLWIECDSIIVVTLLKKMSDRVPWQLYAKWRSCLAFLNEISMQVSHIYREGNGVADVLSKKAIREKSLTWHNLLPVECIPYHVADMWGNKTYRFTE